MLQHSFPSPVVVQLLSCVQLFAASWTAACQAPLSSTISRVCSNSYPLNQRCYLTISSFATLSSFWLPSFLASGFSPSILALHIRWPKDFSFSFSISISPSSEYPGLISFKIDWFHLLSVQGTLRSLLQHQNSKASILRHSYCWFFSQTVRE